MSLIIYFFDCSFSCCWEIVPNAVAELEKVFAWTRISNSPEVEEEKEKGELIDK